LIDIGGQLRNKCFTESKVATIFESVQRGADGIGEG
jgi:hypothetical protein